MLKFKSSDSTVLSFRKIEIFTVENPFECNDFNHLINKPGSPNYLKRTTFKEQNKPHINPLTGVEIKTPIKTRKVKIVTGK